MPQNAQRMILRRMGADALSSREAANWIENAEGVSLLRENPPSSLLVEGPEERIAQVVNQLSGWSASPVVTYAVPDPRPKVLKPAAR